MYSVLALVYYSLYHGQSFTTPLFLYMLTHVTNSVYQS